MFSLLRQSQQIDNGFMTAYFWCVSAAAGLLRYLSAGLPSGLFGAWLPSGHSWIASLSFSRATLQIILGLAT